MDFNTKEFTWKNVEVSLFGDKITAIQGVEYSSKHTKSAIYAAGSKPRCIQTGKMEVSGKLTLLQSELIKLNKHAIANGYNSIAEMEFDIAISYCLPDGIAISDKLLGVHITELKHTITVNDLNQKHEIPFIAMDIQYNVPS